jgi:hypothetical protein
MAKALCAPTESTPRQRGSMACLLGVVLAFLVSGCAPWSGARLIAYAFENDATVHTPLNQRLRYLRVSSPDGRALLVLAQNDNPLAGTGEVWVSARGEIIRLHQGRIVATQGLPVDWRHVSYPQEKPPDWKIIQDKDASPENEAPPDKISTPTYVREIDIMPGYRFNHQEHVRILPAHGVKPQLLFGWKADDLAWVREEGRSRDKGEIVAALFGLQRAASGPPRVIYSEQCLTPDYCLVLQEWPPPTPDHPALSAVQPATAKEQP